MLVNLSNLYAGLTQWKRVSLTRRKLWVRVPYPVPVRFICNNFYNYAESGEKGYHGRLWPCKSWFNSKPRNHICLSSSIGQSIRFIPEMSLVQIPPQVPIGFKCEFTQYIWVYVPTFPSKKTAGKTPLPFIFFKRRVKNEC